MPASHSLKHQALVVEKLSKARFRVELAGGRRVLATVSGMLRLKFTRILPGHHVVVSISPYDLEITLSMKVRASVKRLCETCKIVRRNNVVRVVCTNPRHKQRQG